MGRWPPNSGAGSLTVRITQFLKCQGQAVNHHGVKPQANKCFRTKLNISEYLISCLMLEKLGHHHGCSPHLIWVYCFLWWGIGDNQCWAPIHGFLPHRAHVISMNLGGGRGAWGLVVRHRLEWHTLLGWSGRCCCLCSSPHGCGSRPAFAAGCRQGSPQAGCAAVGVTPWWLLGDGLCWPWQGYLHQSGWHCGDEDNCPLQK